LTAIGALIVGIAAPAQAATVVINDGSPYEYVVHNNSAGEDFSLVLTTMPGSYGVEFSSSDLIDAGNGNGVATVDGPFSDLTIDPLAPILGFTAIQFKLDEPTGRPVDRVFDITVNFTDGTSQFLGNQAFAPNNKLDVLAEGDEVISSITFSGLEGVNPVLPFDFRDIKQVSFDAVFDSAVPEPQSWALLIAGFGLVGGAMRAQRRKPAIA